jgi:hypothetical protein
MDIENFDRVYGFWIILTPEYEDEFFFCNEDGVVANCYLWDLSDLRERFEGGGEISFWT